MRRAWIAPVGSALEVRARLRLGAADVPALGDRGAGEPAALVVALGHQDRAAVALGERPLREQVERLVGQVEQAQQVRHRDARAADAAADLLAREAELLDQQRAGARLLDRVEVLAGHVLDQRELERLGVVVRAHERGDRLEPRELGRAPAALAGDQLVGAVRPPGARARAGARRGPPASRPARAATPRRTPCAAGAGWARSAGPGAGAGRGRPAPPDVGARGQQGRESAAHPPAGLSHAGPPPWRARSRRPHPAQCGSWWMTGRP